MASAVSTPVDPTGLRLRLRSVVVGTWLTIAAAAVFVVYFVATWQAAHRPALVAMSLGAAVVSLALRVLPLERLIRSRWCEPFFVGWSASTMALIAVAASLDGGLSSPLVAGFFIPLCFGALSSPLATMLVIGILIQAAFSAVAMTDSSLHDGFAPCFSGVLALVTWMCAWQARNHEEQRRELQRVSRADPLTGCLNRRGFGERIAADLSHAQRTGAPVGLILLDLDGFKTINDLHGHAAGDALLRLAVTTIEQSVRPMDAVARMGGDEFAVILPGAGGPEIERVADRLRRALAERAPASVGIAAFPADGDDADELYQRADADL
jgi:diguanylate cyclase (GGDEF)-like protein